MPARKNSANPVSSRLCLRNADFLCNLGLGSAGQEPQSQNLLFPFPKRFHRVPETDFLQPVPVIAFVSHLIHYKDGVAAVGIYRLIKGYRVYHRFQSQNQVGLFAVQLPAYFFYSRLPPEPMQKALLCLHCPVSQIPKGTADPDGIVVTKKPAYLTNNHGNSVGGKFHFQLWIEIVYGLD